MGNGGNIRQILTHPWMEDANVSDGTSSRLLRHELPYLFNNSTSHETNMYSKLNVSREEANELIKKHNEVYQIAEDTQEVFKK